MSNLEKLRADLCRLEDLIYKAFQDCNYDEEERYKKAYLEVEAKISEQERIEDQRAEVDLNNFRNDYDSLIHITT